MRKRANTTASCIDSLYGITATETLTFISQEVFDKSKKAQPNDIVMAVTSENVEDVCKCVAWLGDEEIAVSGHTAIIHHDQNPKYSCSLRNTMTGTARIRNC